MNEGWLDLVEFANKYEVSTSTLRRRIRAKSIPFKMQKGRYWLPDNPNVIASTPLYARNIHPKNSQPFVQQSVRSHLPAPSMEEFQNLLQKNRALQAEVSELKTLVSVLESELSKEKSV